MATTSSNESDWEDVTPSPDQTAPSATSSDESDWEDVTPTTTATKPQPVDESQMGVAKGSPVAFDSSYLPLSGAVDAFKQGYDEYGKASKMAYGDNFIGNNAGRPGGIVAGTVMAAGTLLNPIGKLFSGVPKMVQSASEALNGETGNSTRTMTGEREVLPDVKAKAYNTGSQVLDTALNMGSDVATQVRKDPSLLLAADTGGLVKAGAKSGITLNKPYRAVASPIVGDLAEFNKPINGKVVGHVADVFDSMDKERISAALSPNNKGFGTTKNTSAITRGVAEAIRNDPVNTTNLSGLRESSDNAISKIMNEVSTLKEKVAPQDMSSVADSLESIIHKGMSPEDIDIIKTQAAKYRQMYSIDDIHNTTKYLGDKLIPLWASDDAKSSFTRKVMATERHLVNDKLTESLGQVGGERATRLRSTVSDLIKLNDHIDAQAAKLARTIRPELRGSMANLEGRVSLISAVTDLVTGHPAGAVIKGGIALERLIKGSSKADWTNPNKQIQKLNSSLRQKVNFVHDPSPPEPTPYSPQPLPARLENQ